MSFLILNIFVVGGTIGLFTGMSILSFVELIFWIVRYLTKFQIEKPEEPIPNDKIEKEEELNKKKYVSKDNWPLSMKSRWGQSFKF